MMKKQIAMDRYGVSGVVAGFLQLWIHVVVGANINLAFNLRFLLIGHNIVERYGDRAGIQQF